MKALRRSLPFVSLVCLALLACGRGNQSTDAPESPPGTQFSQPEAAEMTAEDAVNHIKSLAERGSLKTAVNVRYTETSTKRVPCTALEVAQEESRYPNNPELRDCKSTGGISHFKTVTQTESRCCRVKQVPIPTNVAWRASKDEDGMWRVEGDFALEGQQHHAIFLVASQTKEVTPVSL